MWMRNACRFEGRIIPVVYRDIDTMRRKGLSLVRFSKGANRNESGWYSFWLAVGPPDDNNRSHVLTFRIRAGESPALRLRRARKDLPSFQKAIDEVIVISPAPKKKIETWLRNHPNDIMKA